LSRIPQWDANTVTTRIHASFCPFCFQMLDAVSSMQDKKVPEPGDFTICIECGAVLRFDAKMDLLASSLEDIPMASRLGFAKVVMEIKKRGPFKREAIKPD
jgi:hypothetical protein